MILTCTLFFIINTTVISGYCQIAKVPDKVSLSASKALFNQEYESAKLEFLQALELYKIENDVRKILECRMALASIDYLNLKYFNALNMFRSIHTEHAKHFPNDKDTLAIIEDNIKRCHFQIERNIKIIKKKKG